MEASVRIKANFESADNRQLSQSLKDKGLAVKETNVPFCPSPIVYTGEGERLEGRETICQHFGLAASPEAHL